MPPGYHCAGKGKETLKEPPEWTEVGSDLTEKQCGTNKIAPHRGRSKYRFDDFGND